MTNRRYQDDLAWVHHTGFADLARAAAPHLLGQLRAHGIHTGRVVDLGCGSGLLLKALLRAGYAAVGVDLSAAMLKLARREAPGAVLKRGSLYQVPLPRCQAVFAVGEPLNYDTASIPLLFSKVARALEPGGLFAFDVIVRGAPSLSRARHLSGKGWDLFVTTRDEGQVMWREVVCFAQQPGQQGFTRSHELHRVRVLEVGTVMRQLRAAGFSVQLGGHYGRFALPVRRRAFLCVRRTAR